MNVCIVEINLLSLVTSQDQSRSTALILMALACAPSVLVKKENIPRKGRPRIPKRRSNGDGSLTERKDGLWVGRISHEGKRISVYGKAKEQARQKLRALQRKQDQGLPLVTANMLLRDYLAQWLDDIRHQIRPKTLADYEAIVRCHLTPRLGQVRLGKLGPEHVQKACNHMLKEGKSRNLVEHCHLRLSKALNDAVRRQLIYRNPCQAVSPPRASAKELHPPDAAAVQRLLEAARDTEYYEAMHTASTQACGGGSCWL